MITNNEIQDLVLALEESRCVAAVAADAEFLSRVFHDDLVYIHASGRTDTKSSYLASLASGRLKYHRMERDDVTIRVFNTTTAIVTGRSITVTESKGAVHENCIRFTNVWVRVHDGTDEWRLATWQSTKIAPVM